MPKVTVDPRKCEGARKCVEICPMDVFALRAPDPALPFFVRLKVRVHGGMQAYVAREEACAGCGECTSACPEDAIRVTLDDAQAPGNEARAMT
jgi:NAD-dependent dihydropyrimidine dehydrogenase PreA subunit